MLQQTRVETVVDYYVKWMSLFPTPKALAEADLEQVSFLFFVEFIEKKRFCWSVLVIPPAHSGDHTTFNFLLQLKSPSPFLRRVFSSFPDKARLQRSVLSRMMRVLVVVALAREKRLSVSVPTRVWTRFMATG